MTAKKRTKNREKKRISVRVCVSFGRHETADKVTKDWIENKEKEL